MNQLKVGHARQGCKDGRSTMTIQWCKLLLTCSTLEMGSRSIPKVKCPSQEAKSRRRWRATLVKMTIMNQEYVGCSATK